MSHLSKEPCPKHQTKTNSSFFIYEFEEKSTHTSVRRFGNDIEDP